MSGDTKTTKSEELFYRFILDINVNKKIDAIRDELGIHIDGFSSLKEGKKWFSRIPVKTYRKLLNRYFDLMDKYKLPNHISNLLESYIICGIKSEWFYQVNDHMMFCEFDPDPKLEEYWIKQNQPFVKLFIFEHTDEKYVRKFIERNWKRIKRRLAEKGASLKRLSPMKEVKRNLLIMRLYAKPKAELEKMLGKTFSYKKAVVASLMLNKYKIKVSEDAVEKVFYNHRHFKGF